MNCKQTQELILTDYLDGQLDQAQKETLEDHLLSCVSCQELFTSVRKAAAEPFETSALIDVPPSAWENIKTSIEARPARKVFSFTEALAVALTVVIVLAGTFFWSRPEFHPQVAKPAVDQQQLQDVSYAVSELAFFIEEIDLDEHTDIEQYFL